MPKEKVILGKDSLHSELAHKCLSFSFEWYSQSTLIADEHLWLWMNKRAILEVASNFTLHKVQDEKEMSIETFDFQNFEAITNRLLFTSRIRGTVGLVRYFVHELQFWLEFFHLLRFSVWESIILFLF